ncbi:MAG: Ig-like domain-containing protein [Solirubrobacterales bacterium]
MHSRGRGLLKVSAIVLLVFVSIMAGAAAACAETRSIIVTDDSGWAVLESNSEVVVWSPYEPEAEPGSGKWMNGVGIWPQIGEVFRQRVALKFPLGGVPGFINEARLVLTVGQSNGTPPQVTIYSTTDNSWAEGTPGYFPSFGQTYDLNALLDGTHGWELLHANGQVINGQNEFIITNFLKSRQFVSNEATVVMAGNENSEPPNDFSFYAEEYGISNANKPRLDITYTPNSAPSGLALSANTVAENMASGTVVGTLSAQDVDISSCGDVLSYAIVGANSDSGFTLDGNTLKTTASFNYEVKNSYSVQVKVTDRFGVQEVKTFTINITNVNEMPTLSSFIPFNSVEDTPYTINFNTMLGMSNQSDPDGDQISFLIKSVDNGSLTKGVITVTPGMTLSSGESMIWTPAANANGNIAAFTVRAFDGALESFSSVPVNFNVTPVPDAPTLTTVNPLTGGLENAPVTITYTALAAAANEADVDGGSISFRVEAVSTGTLTKGGTEVMAGVTTLSSGESLLWTPAAKANGTLDAFTVKAYDGLNLSASEVQVKVTVQSVNEVPTLGAISTLAGGTEDTQYEIPYAALFGASDAADGDGDAISFRVEAVSTGGLTKGGSAVTPGTTTLSDNEKLVWTPAPNANGTLNAFTVKAYDGTAASANAVQVQVAVTAVNDAPVLTSINTLTGATEDTAYPITYAALKAAAADEADADGDVISFRVAAVSTGSLTKGGTAVTPGVTILASEEQLIWTPAANANGTLNAFFVMAYDGANLSAGAVQVLVETEPFRDAPTLTTVNPLTGGLEDAPVTITYAALAAAADEADADGDVIRFRVEAVSTGSLTKGGSAVTSGDTTLGSGESLLWTPAAKANGTLNAFTISAYDGSNLSEFAIQVKITVQAVNEAPALGAISTLAGGTEDTQYEISYANLFGASDAEDGDGDAISFRVEAVSTGSLTKGGSAVTLGTTTLSDTEKLVWTPASNANGTVNAFTVKAYDGTAASANAVQVQVAVTAVNDAPVLTSINTLTGATEDTAYPITYTALKDAAADEADADGDTISFRVETVNTGSLTKGGNAVIPGVTVLASGEQLVWTPAANASGTLNAFTVKAYDGTDLSAGAVQVKVETAAVNDPPVMTVNTGKTLAKGASVVIGGTAMLAADAEHAAADLTYTVTVIPGRGSLKKSDTTLKVGDTFTQADVDGNLLSYTHTSTETATSDSFRFTVSDGAGGTMAATAFTLTITFESAPVSTGGSGGSGGSSFGVVTPSQVSTGANGLSVTVDGNTVTIGNSTTTTKGDQSTTTVVLDSSKWEQAITRTGDNPVLSIPVHSKSDVVVASLNGQMIQSMENRQASISIQTQAAAYTLPAGQIDMKSISNLLGQPAGIENITVQVTIAKTDQTMVKVVENSAVKGDLTIIAPPVDFTVTCSTKDKSVTVSQFSGYVERTIAIPDGVDPSRVTTGVIVEPDGTMRPVPTKVVQIEGKYYARINSLSNSTYAVIGSPRAFSDCTGHWAQTAVNDMASRLVIGGYEGNRFKPDRDITRAEFAVITVQVLGLNSPGKSVPYTDVNRSAWYYDAVRMAGQYGLISGYADGTFKPDQKINRQEAMIILGKAMALAKPGGSIAETDIEKQLASFSDRTQISSWAKKAVAGCIQKGLVSGYQGKINPERNISRAETAVMMRNLLQKANLI